MDSDVQVIWSFLKMSTTVKNSALAVALSVVFLASSAGALEDIRLANGKPCYSTERTLYAEDGVTPFQCQASGGPAYAFKVYVGEKLLWDGILSAKKASVQFDLPGGVAGKQTPQLVLTRDLKSDPDGHVIFFGEERLQAVLNLESEDGSVHVPTTQSIGISLRVKDTTIVDPVGPIAGSLVDFSTYRLVVRPAS